MTRLYIPNKERTAQQQAELPIAFRTIERWSASLPTSGGYVSLTGPGQTATPGNLTQHGGFTVNDSAGSGIYMDTTTGGFYVQSGNHTGGPYTVASGGVYITDIGQAANGINPGFMQIETDGEMHINAGQSSAAATSTSGMYISNTAWGSPGGDGLYITNNGDGGLNLTDRAVAGHAATGMFLQSDTYIGLLTGGASSNNPSGIELQSANATIAITAANPLYTDTAHPAILLNSSGVGHGTRILDTSVLGISIESQSAGVPMALSGSGNLTMSFAGNITMNLPTTAPVTAGALWNSGGVVHIV